MAAKTKLQAWGEGPTPNPEKPKEVHLRLRQSSDGVIVYAADENGVAYPSGNLVYITEQGVMRFTGVNKGLGFDIDPSGRLQDKSW